MKLVKNALLALAILSGITIPGVAADNCFAAGQQYASSQGATLVAAEATTKDGAAACKIVILKQSDDSRPKREVVYLPG